MVDFAVVPARTAMVNVDMQRIFPTHFEERQTICEGYVHSCSIM